MKYIGNNPYVRIMNKKPLHEEKNFVKKSISIYNVDIQILILL